MRAHACFSLSAYVRACASVSVCARASVPPHLRERSVVSTHASVPSGFSQMIACSDRLPHQHRRIQADRTPNRRGGVGGAVSGAVTMS